MKVKAFIDSNVFIYAFEFQKSNSATILELINEDKIEAFINMDVLLEVSKYFRQYHSREHSNKYVKYLLEICSIIDESNYLDELKKLKGKIKEKDLPQISSVKALGLKYIVSFDRDFIEFEEHKTPKQFLKELSIKTETTEY